MSTAVDYKRRQIVGRGIPVPGNDIDTDRIIPARFLKEVTFETMGQHAFEDARKQNPEHPFNSPAYKGASVLVVGQNFGCGSSREHAPQALMPDETPSHPYEPAIESAMLAPKAELTFFPWKDTKEKIPLAVRHVRTFLKANR